MEVMKAPERTVVVVSRVSMLRICTAADCTTIVFGQGTCIEHDQLEATVTAHSSASASTPSGQPREAAETLAAAT